MSPPGRSRASRWLGWTARLVPRHRRREWLAEWQAELDALEAERGRNGGPHLPEPMAFVAGALPHALWIRTEEWTMEGVVQDLRFAARVLRRSPGFAVVAVLTLALGIGANGAIFSLVDGLVMRSPSGVHEPDRLVQIARSYDEAPRWDNWSWPALRTIRAEGRVFEDVAGYSGRILVVGSGMDAEQVSAEMVTGNYFEVLGVRPAAGRLLGPADDVTPGAHPVTVVGFDLWQRRYGGDPGVVGTTVLVGGSAFEIVGVAPAAFAGVENLGSSPQLFVPAAMAPGFRGRLPFEEWGWSWIDAVGRLADGTTFEAARAAMDVVTDRLRAADPANDDVRILLAEGVGLSPSDRTEAERVSLLLLAVAGLVLMLTCANVANLFVARATTRRTEMGVRLALGAGRGRLSRQLVTESLLLGAMAAVVAAVPLLFAARLLPALLPFALTTSLAPTPAVFAALLGLGLLAGLLFGAVPAVVASRRDLAGTLRSSGTTGATSRTRARDALVVLQLALSLGLLAGAMLLGGSLLRAAAADPGFQPRGVLVATMDLEATGRYDRAATARFAEEMARRARALPGVERATVASQAPFFGGYARATREPLDHPDPASVEVEAEAISVGEDYFATLGIPVLAGRPLSASDEEGEAVAVVNAALAERYWPGESAVGKRLGGEVPVRIVGVVGDVQYRSLRTGPLPAVYQPMTESFTQRLALQVRTSGTDPAGLTADVRRLVAEMDPGVPLTTIAPLHDRMASSLGTTRTFALLVTTFAGLALILSVVGLYGLVAFGVAQRVREMGIRMALGAAPGGLVGLVLRRALALAVVGTLAGLALAVGVGRALESFLYGVDAASPAALGAAALTLVAAAGLAAWLPARRASRVDAAVSLRD